MKNFRWIGASVAKPVKMKSKLLTKENYESFKCGDLVVSVEDYVLIRNGDVGDHDSRSLDTCFIGRVEALYDNSFKTRIGDDEVEDRYRAVITWYSRPHEIPKKHQRSMSNSSQSNFPEVIEDLRLFDNDIDAETIFEKCKVIVVDAELKNVTSKILPSNGIPWFIVRWKYDGKTLEPILCNAKHTLRFNRRRVAPLEITPSSTNSKRKTKVQQQLNANSKKSNEDVVSDSSEEIDLQYPIRKPSQRGEEIEGELNTNVVRSHTHNQLQNKPSPFRNFYSPKRVQNSPESIESPNVPQSSRYNMSNLEKTTLSISSQSRNSAESRLSSKKQNEEDVIACSSDGIDSQYAIKKTPQHGDEDANADMSLTPSQLQSKRSPFRNFYSPKRVQNSFRLVRQLTFTSPIKETLDPNALLTCPAKLSQNLEKIKQSATQHTPKCNDVDLDHQLEVQNDQRNYTVKVTNLTPIGERVKRKLLSDQQGTNEDRDTSKDFIRTRSGRTVNTIRELGPSPIKRKSDVNCNTAAESRLIRKNTSQKDDSVKNRTEDNCLSANRSLTILRTRSGRKVQSRRTTLSDTEDQQMDDADDSSWDGTSSSYDSTGSYCCTSQRKSPRSLAGRSKSATPVKATHQRSKRTLTPFIPMREASCRLPETSLEELRARLHVSSVPDTLPCRENEFADIYSFVEGKITDRSGGCMYISGVPGTGKTATVREVVRCLKHSSERNEIPQFVFVDINGMKLTEPHQAYVEIYQQLTDCKLTAAHAAKSLEKRFSKSGFQKDMVLLLVDELDLLWTRNQDVLYNLFEWPNKPHSRVILLAIANTMDLPERMMKSRIASRVGLTRLTFQPYNFKQLQEIISARLQNDTIFHADAVQLAARKVAALSGDARRALDICRRATEIVERMPPSPAKRNSTLIGMSEVDLAIQEMFSLPKIEAIRHASFQEQLFLRATMSEFQRTGLEEATLSRIYKQHMVLCRVEGLQVPNVTQVAAIAHRLGNCRLLLVENGSHDTLQRIRLNVGIDDVNYALKTL